MAMNDATRSEGLKGLALLWFGVLGGAAAWAIRLTFSYAIVAIGCDFGLTGPAAFGLTMLDMAALTVTAITALVSAVATFVSWRIWRRTRRGAWEHSGGPVGRSGYLAIFGVLMSGLFVIVILMEGSAVLFLDICAR